VRPLSPLWRERLITTTQRAEFLWEVEYDIETAAGIEHRYASFTSDDELMDEQVLDMALDKAEEGVYGEVVDVRITERWHATL
jgi:hypothetical protein